MVDGVLHASNGLELAEAFDPARGARHAAEFVAFALPYVARRLQRADVRCGRRRRRLLL
jgi:hypothetical protein